MPVPKKRHSQSRQGKRLSHQHLDVPPLTKCPSCSELIANFTTCPFCGKYQGRQILIIKPKKEKKK